MAEIDYTKQEMAIGQTWIGRNCSFLYRVLRNADRDDCWGRAAEVGFTLMFALFTALILFVAILSSVGANPDNFNSVLIFLGSFLPFEIYALIRKEIIDLAQTPTKAIVLFGVAGTAWTLSNLMMILTKCFQQSYEVKETRSFWKLRLIASILAFTVALFMAIVLNLLVFGIEIARFIDQTYGYANTMALLIRVLRMPLAFLMTTILATLLYRVLPNVKQTIWEVLPGALFFSILWFLFNKGFGYYLTNFPHYNTTYGTLGAGLILMIWMYLTALSILIGSEVNAELYRRKTVRHLTPDLSVQMVD